MAPYASPHEHNECTFTSRTMRAYGASQQAKESNVTQPEARVGRKIAAWLMEQGHFVFKVHGSALMMAGLPDLIACVDGRFIGIEVKMPGNKPSIRQLYVHRRIERSGGTIIVAYNLDDVKKVLE